MDGIGNAVGQLIRLLALIALAGIGALVAIVFAAFGATGLWLFLFPAAGLVVGLIVNATILGD